MADVLTPNIDTVLLRVRDQGVGIARPELKRIFKRFYRVQCSASRQVKGTGLGLFIVRSVARAHGGDAFAESEGEGAAALSFCDSRGLIAYEPDPRRGR